MTLSRSFRTPLITYSTHQPRESGSPLNESEGNGKMPTTVSHSLPSDWIKYLSIDPSILPFKFPRYVPAIERVLLRSVVDENGCWLYQGSLDAGGYSVLRAGSKNERGHRVTWQTLNGPVPVDRHLDHLCRVRSCVNVYHLEPVTVAENTFGRALWANGLPKATHCQRGHEMTEANTYIRPDSGDRQCRSCIQRRTEASEKVRKAEVAARRASRKPRPHGDPVKYSYEGCRCDECRTAATKRGRENRAKKRSTNRLPTSD